MAMLWGVVRREIRTLSVLAITRGWPGGVTACLLLALCVGQLAKAQTAGPEVAKEDFAPESVPTISTFVDEVRLNFTVTNAKGKFVKSLGARDFKLLDAGRPPEKMLQFRASSDTPLQVSLLFDISSSIRYRLDFEKKAAKHFLKDILRPQTDQANIIAFGTDVREIQPITSDVEKLMSAVSQLQAGGDTALYDAIGRAEADLRQAGAGGESRKVIIIISDGADTASRDREKECVQAAITSEAMILVVDASVPSEHNSSGQRFLQKLANDSGGFVLPARQDEELKGAFRTIEEVLRSQYWVSYKPAMLERNGRYRGIQVLALKPGLKVHHRKGYYAPK